MKDRLNFSLKGRIIAKTKIADWPKVSKFHLRLYLTESNDYLIRHSTPVRIAREIYFPSLLPTEPVYFPCAAS